MAGERGFVPSRNFERPGSGDPRSEIALRKADLVRAEFTSAAESVLKILDTFPTRQVILPRDNKLTYSNDPVWVKFVNVTTHDADVHVSITQDPGLYSMATVSWLTKGDNPEIGVVMWHKPTEYQSLSFKNGVPIISRHTGEEEVATRWSKQPSKTTIEYWRERAGAGFDNAISANILLDPARFPWLVSLLADIAEQPNSYEPEATKTALKMFKDKYGGQEMIDSAPERTRIVPLAITE